MFHSISAVRQAKQILLGQVRKQTQRGCVMECGHEKVLVRELGPSGSSSAPRW